MDPQKRAPSHDDAMAVLSHLQKEQTNHVHLFPPTAGGTSTPVPGQQAGYNTLLDYIKKLEAKIEKASARTEDHDELTSNYSLRSPTSVRDSFIPGQWITHAKRYKRLHYRYGNPVIADDNESVDDVRQRERAERSGGHVLKVYHEYDWDGRDLGTKLDVRSPYISHALRTIIDHYPDPEFNALSK